MNTFFIILSFITGCFLGSFFCLVGDRLPVKKSIVAPRSHCSNCNHILKWYELIPVFSYIIQKGKCRNCKQSISVFCPITELLSGFLYMVSFYVYGFSIETIICILIASFFIIVLVSDINYMIIPDEITLFFSIVMLIIRIIEGSFLSSLISGIVLFFIMYSIMIIGNKLFKKETLGGADIKLMFFIGLVLSPVIGVFNIFLASFIALPVSLILMVRNKENMIPFGPFLLISTFFLYLISFDYITFFNL